jgi:F0F1-type ATP synthase delta subunit
LEDCPEYLRPEFKEKDYTYYFPNGSEIQLAGTDAGHAEKLRGGDSDLFFVDEAGSCSDLENIIKDILLPTTLTTRGRGILASTPPKTFDHDFIKYIEESEMRGSLIKKTIDDNPRLTEEHKKELFDELGGSNTEAARRELYCEIIKDSTTSVIPEFTPELEKEIVQEWKTPPYYDCYVGMDLGFKDLTALVFGYYDFKAGKLIIQDELVYNFQEKDKNLEDLSKKIIEKEKELWTNPLTYEVKKPALRVSDIDYIVLNEISKHSNKEVVFQIANKYDNESSINSLRLMVGNKKIIINPKCVNLIRHLRNAKWHKSKKIFDRSPDDGHYDCVEALKYLVKNINYKKNPYPSNYEINMGDLFVRNKDNYDKQSGTSVIDTYKKIFNIKPMNKRKW